LSYNCWTSALHSDAHPLKTSSSLEKKGNVLLAASAATKLYGLCNARAALPTGETLTPCLPVSDWQRCSVGLAKVRAAPLGGGRRAAARRMFGKMPVQVGSWLALPDRCSTKRARSSPSWGRRWRARPARDPNSRRAATGGGRGPCTPAAGAAQCWRRAAGTCRHVGPTELRAGLPLYQVCARCPAATLPCHFSAHASDGGASTWTLPSWKLPISVWWTGKGKIRHGFLVRISGIQRKSLIRKSVTQSYL
jgi:hypothetical protein